jgi:hypothetical protein
MRKSTAELNKREDPASRQNPRKTYCRPEILESLPIHRAAELAAMSDCPLRR